MMEALDSILSPSQHSSSKLIDSKLQNPNCSRSSPSPSVTRLWRPAAQRNLRNQWSKLLAHKQQWVSASLSGRSHATSLVNAHLSQRYMSAMDLGVLSEMPDIRKKACCKLAQQQELHGSKLLSSYKDMVVIISHMVNTCNSMRCFLKGPASSPLVQFSSYSEDKNDSGDGGGIPVFTFWSVPYFENLGQELLQMFALELSLKRLLVVELLCISCGEVSHQADGLCWSDELYPGEFDDLSTINMYSKETCQPIPPRMKSWESDTSRTVRSNHRPNQEILQRKELILEGIQKWDNKEAKEGLQEEEKLVRVCAKLADAGLPPTEGNNFWTSLLSIVVWGIIFMLLNNWKKIKQFCRGLSATARETTVQNVTLGYIYPVPIVAQPTLVSPVAVSYVATALLGLAMQVLF